MSVAQPPLPPRLPPRRRVPPPPPRAITEEDGVEQNEITQGIAARIASLQLRQLDRARPQPPVQVRLTEGQRDGLVALKDAPQEECGVVEDVEHPRSPRGAPPPIPPKWTRPNPEDLARLLARPPPPPPTKRFPVPEVETVPSPDPSPREVGPPRRRLPPAPTRLPTPPPGLEQQHEKVDSETGTGSQYDDQNSCLECRDFSNVDAHAALFPRHTVTSLDNLAYDLTEPFPYEVEKARAIFTWLHHNIAYDAESFFSGNIQACTAESTLASGLAVCDGYAGLFKSLAERVGIQTHKVTGHGKGLGFEAVGPDHPVPEYSSGHAWNCAFLDGKWHLIDACWGAGALYGSTYRQRFDPRWFTSAPAEFGRTHFPEDHSYQLRSAEEGGPVSWEDYIMAPAGPVIFVDFYLLDLWPFALQPSIRNIESGTRTNFQVFKRCEHMSTAEANNFVYMISIGSERVPLELDAEGGWSANIYIPSGATEASLYYVKTVGGEDAQGIGLWALKDALGRKAMTFGGLACWTVV
ncbi:putative transglutaminase-like superfamily protein [Lyophyllum shimeji]|uniref:Transglutaminase-like superfamily protein n=1 Tax=Lyophyllum shimeji TaxID=47721 RepID=A0A9P3UN45_LYOSH|nr:putative transglutaminase-like superfamily protein [Lyophyllum shimeji]